MQITITPEERESLIELSKIPGHETTVYTVTIDGGQQVKLPLKIVLDIINSTNQPKDTNNG
jgi:hypothetical protein